MVERALRQETELSTVEEGAGDVPRIVSPACNPHNSNYGEESRWPDCLVSGLGGNGSEQVVRSFSVQRQSWLRPGVANRQVEQRAEGSGERTVPRGDERGQRFSAGFASRAVRCLCRRL
jgi:hypothetical protein